MLRFFFASFNVRIKSTRL